MAKKQFTSSFNDIFAPSVEKPPVANDVPLNSKVDESALVIQRTTILLNRDTYETVRAIAWYNRRPIKDYIEDALRLIINNYPQDELIRMRTEFSQRLGSR
jgi:hypothetical protein